ncbi:MAG: hypothetical protein IJP86_03180 [Synergistaceae bacterium]|nr:hypothetical protein [Synergistaceae bacterium]
MTNEEKFERSIAFVLKWEGGRNFSVVNGKAIVKGSARADMGGATAYGITWKTLESAHRKGIVSHGDICRLTIEEAKGIYRVNYWERYNWGMLEWPVCLCALDCCVNHGGFAYILQRAVNRCGGNVVVDGKMGPKTFAGMQGCEAEELSRGIYEERKKYFEGIVRRKPGQGVFLKGWLRRCEEMRRESGV